MATEKELPQQISWLNFIPLAILCDLLGWLSEPFQWLSDLQLGEKKVTLNHLASFHVFGNI